MREVEFLPDWYPKVRKRKRIMALQAWVTLILMSGLGLWMLLVQRNVHAREVELVGLRTDLDQSETELARLEDLLQLQRQLAQQDQIFVKIGRPVETTKVISTLEQMMPRDMALLDLTLDTEEAQPVRPLGGSGGLASRAQREGREQAVAKLRFKMHGVAPTDMDLGDFLAKLTAKPFFRNVELMYSHERQDRGHVMREFEVAFTMDLTGAAAMTSMGGGR
jgi:Tfp pilus assembly protein PilN